MASFSAHDKAGHRGCDCELAVGVERGVHGTVGHCGYDYELEEEEHDGHDKLHLHVNEHVIDEVEVEVEVFDVNMSCYDLPSSATFDSCDCSKE